MTEQRAPDDEELRVPPGYVANLFDLAGRVAVVTGGGSGLGQAIAIGYAQAGVTVIVADVNDAGSAETVARIAEQGGTAHAHHLDVTVARPRWTRSPTWSSTEHGRVDILVNSAGSAFRSPAEDFPEEKLDFILDLNLKGTYLCCQAFGRKMLAQGKGSIINLASIGGFIAYPWASAYLASKGGVLGVTRGLALEWRDRGVRVNGIGPTLMDSPLTRDRGAAHLASPPTSSRRACCGRGWACRGSSSVPPSSSPATPPSWSPATPSCATTGTSSPSPIRRVLAGEDHARRRPDRPGPRRHHPAPSSRCPSCSAPGSCATGSSSWCASTPRAACRASPMA